MPGKSHAVTILFFNSALLAFLSFWQIYSNIFNVENSSSVSLYLTFQWSPYGAITLRHCWFCNRGNGIRPVKHTQSLFYGHNTGQPVFAAPPINNWLVSWSLTFLFSTNMAISETKLTTVGFCYGKVLLPACICQWQLVHSDYGEGAKFSSTALPAVH